ncbi:MAG: AAA family ATPase [Patescibacteria group bacterium]|nr:AAA family ATPase [Patescibacteria group bacterium]
MIKKLIIENFRSIKKVEINLGPMNAFIGPNNAGKSNIMKALNLILGENYPSVRSFEENDFYNYDKSNPIKIVTIFSSGLSSNYKVWGFQLTFNGNDCEYVAVDNNGNILTYPGGKEVRVSNEMRNEVALMYLGLNRQAEQQIRPTQWTLYGKLLRHIEKQINQSKKENFRKGIQNAYDSNIYPDLQEMENSLKDHVKEQTGLDLHLRLSILDPIETIKNLRPYFQEAQTSQEFDAEDMGTGTQSALAVAIARAYAKIIRQSLGMAIEEPELYLHPHGCRHFYKLLKKLSENGIQIIYTTHERSFVDLANFQSIHLIRKEFGKTEVYSGTGKKISDENETKLVSKFDEDINEVFFAHNVILTEGFDDEIACRIALQKLGIELDKDNISVTECGSNTAIKPISEVLKIFKIPTYALLDEDPGNSKTQRIILELKSFLGEDKIFLQQPNLEGIFGLDRKLSKTEALRFFPKWFEQNDVPEIYKNVEKRLKVQKSKCKS